MASNRSFILLIFGVKLEDIRESLTRIPIEARASAGRGSRSSEKSALHPSLIDFANYMPLPHTFVSPVEHPKTTNLLCWHCSLAFTGSPKFIPLESVRRSPQVIDGVLHDQYEWAIDGNFCSWACVAAYIEQYYSDPKKWTIRQNLAIVRSQIEGIPIHLVASAPPRIKMSLYCGATGMSQQDYLEEVESLSRR
jgi:hypothetical protein